MNQGFLIPSPLGDIALRVEDEALTGVYFSGQKYFPTLSMSVDASVAVGCRAVPSIVQRAREQLAEFFAGERHRFDLTLRMHGTTFQRRVWQALQDIPYGLVVSYGDIARDIGLGSGHARAVGAANGRNPISIIVPCHRVIGGSGALTGYAGGIERKQALLALEKNGQHLPLFKHTVPLSHAKAAA
jgi:methylated-DNA-[protein]-cysteine S-methyltransferase